jgi:hypothetical protein
MDKALAEFQNFMFWGRIINKVRFAVDMAKWLIHRYIDWLINLLIDLYAAY